MKRAKAEENLRGKSIEDLRRILESYGKKPPAESLLSEKAMKEGLIQAILGCMFVSTEHNHGAHRPTM